MMEPSSVFQSEQGEGPRCLCHRTTWEQRLRNSSFLGAPVRSI